MTTPVDAAIAAARAAGNQPAAASPAPALVPATAGATAVAAAPVRAPAMTLQDFSAGGMSVDAYLKVGFYGITFDKDAKLFEGVTVDIDLRSVQVTEAIKFGNPAQYFKTYDRVNCTTGGTWQAAIARAQAADAKARPYMSADIPMELVEAITLKDGKVLPAGTKIGHSLSTTNRANFDNFLKDVGSAGIDQSATVRVQIGFEARDKNNNKWGLVTFKLLGKSEDFAEGEAA